MENTVRRKGWSPYLAGFLTGILMIVSVFATGKYFGASTSFVRTADMIGYCPGTSVGALGEGRWDAVPGIFGMLAGAALFAEAYPFLKGTVLTWGDLGKISIPQALRVNHWFVIVLIVISALLLFRWFEKKSL